ncbi:MAG: hypothetical protein J0I34_15490 [Pseudonocardia sp.]|uniref:hypothetical protein n=1 Tax=unclassified Pseudonocardia TaxID=2619320 RepID=UPI00086EF33E|nr:MULTISPECIES: hypothetical protein [unclassified Pseudonocardia]MBN9110177.1 hypothetical protein [Pseudonocardia sp.]ODV07285.1 MAG: hypothetical protein ABT15_09560 [Pseudonocardia sp. SCN 73-27]
MGLTVLAAATATALVTAGLAPAVTTTSVDPAACPTPAAVTAPACAGGSSAGAGSATVPGAAACPGTAIVTKRPFFQKADWLWDPIPDGAKLDPQSSAMAEELSSGDHILNTGDFGVALVDPDDIPDDAPRSTVPVSENWGPDPLAGLQVPVPPDLKIPPGSDGHVAIADEKSNTVVNLWVTQKSGNGLRANWGAAVPFDGDGREHNGSSTGAGIARYASVVRAEEIADGHIPHALFFSTNVVKPKEVRYPATKTDGSNMDGAGSPIPEGARVQLDPSVDVDAIPGISAGEKTIATALQTYGAYVGDNGGARMAFIAEYAPDSDAYEKAGLSGDYVGLKSIPWNKLRVLSDWSGGTQPTPADPDSSSSTSSSSDDDSADTEQIPPTTPAAPADCVPGGGAAVVPGAPAVPGTPAVPPTAPLVPRTAGVVPQAPPVVPQTAPVVPTTTAPVVPASPGEVPVG